MSFSIQGFNSENTRKFLEILNWKRINSQPHRLINIEETDTVVLRQKNSEEMSLKEKNSYTHIWWQRMLNYYDHTMNAAGTYEGVSKSFRTGCLERELPLIKLSATRCSFIAILWVTLVSFAAITLFAASERVIPQVSLYFVIDSARKFLTQPRTIFDTFIWECNFWRTWDGVINMYGISK